MSKVPLTRKAQMPPDMSEQFTGQGPMGGPSSTEDFDLARITFLSSIEPLLDYVENDMNQGVRPAPGDEQIHQALLNAQSAANRASTPQDLDQILKETINQIKSVGVASNYQQPILQSLSNLGLQMYSTMVPSEQVAAAMKIATKVLAQVSPRFELNYPEYDKNIGPTGFEGQRFENPYAKDDRSMQKNVNPSMQMNPQDKESMQQVVDLIAQAVNLTHDINHPSRNILERLIVDLSKALMNARRLMFQLNDPSGGQ